MKAFQITKSITPRDTMSLNLFLKDLAKTKPLQKEEEKELAIKIKQGLLAEEQKENTGSTEFDDIIKEGIIARNKLVSANLRFVVSVAKIYQGRGLDLEDLISEGVAGLVKAAEKFDETKNFKFISYAVWWIRQSIMRSIIYQTGAVRLPTSQIEPITKLNKLADEFEQREYRRPSISELAEISGMEEEKVADLLTSTNFSISIDAPSMEDEDCTLIDVIENPNASKADALVENNSLKSNIEFILSKLSPREHDIICMVFGLNGIPEMSFEDIGRKFALTGERVRQIKEIVLNKFRTDFKEYFENL